MNSSETTYSIALVGQPNVGKSSVFNALTGLSQYVSNWPGKTCEEQVGRYHHNGITVNIVDLPGAYSLTASTIEEQIVRNCVLQGHPDALIIVVDAISLERDLYLVAELLYLQVPLVVGINKIDLAAEEGILIETHVLQAALGVSVVALVASKNQGVQELIEAAIQAASQRQSWAPNRPEIRKDHQEVLREIESLIKGYVPEPYPLDWAALKLLEGDDDVTRLIQQQMGSTWEKVNAVLIQHDDAFLAVAGGRYDWIGRMIRAAVVNPRIGQVTTTDRIDRAATHPIWGFLILLGVLGSIFWLTYTLGTPLQTWLETHVVQAGAGWVRQWMNAAPYWMVELIAGGILPGVGTVLTLFPVLLIFFTALGLLEDIGYMARAAYVMDRFMHLMGLHGKSFLPLFLGFGCNVPAVMGTRTIESPKARLITILVAPLVPCTARLTVLAFLSPIFFGANAVWVTGGMLGLSLVVLILLGVVLHELFLGGEHTVFIMELPLFNPPNLKNIIRGVWQRALDFIKTAGSIILIVSMLMWVLSNYPGGGIESSYLAYLGKLLAPLGSWMGLDWQMMVALLTSFVRKENTIPTLAVLYGSGQHGAGLAAVLSSRLVPAAALAFLAVQVLFIPCVATLATIRQETHSWRWTILSFSLLLVISLGAGVLIYQVGRLAGWGV